MFKVFPFVTFLHVNMHDCAAFCAHLDTELTQLCLPSTAVLTPCTEGMRLETAALAPPTVQRMDFLSFFFFSFFQQQLREQINLAMLL